MGSPSWLLQGVWRRPDAELPLQGPPTGQQQRLRPLPVAVRGEFPGGEKSATSTSSFSDFDVQTLPTARNLSPPALSGPRGSLRPPPAPRALVPTAAGAQETE